MNFIIISYYYFFTSSFMCVWRFYCIILPVLKNKITIFALECKKNRGDTKLLDNIKKQEDLIWIHTLLNVMLFSLHSLTLFPILQYTQVYIVYELLMSIITRDSLRYCVTCDTKFGAVNAEKLNSRRIGTHLANSIGYAPWKTLCIVWLPLSVYLTVIPRRIKKVGRSKKPLRQISEFCSFVS